MAWRLFPAVAFNLIRQRLKSVIHTITTEAFRRQLRRKLECAIIYRLNRSRDKTGVRYDT
jgi:hypothetical protein